MSLTQAALGVLTAKRRASQITLNRHRVFGVGGAAKAPAHTRAQPRRSHQARHTLARDPLPALAQLRMHPRTAVAAVALGVDRGHLQPQALVLTPTLRRRPFAPGVVARARDLQHPAQQRHRVPGLLRRDQRESHWFSLAKKAVAFFRISRSIGSRWFSRLSSTSSSRSPRLSEPAGPRPASTSACSTQRRKAVSPIPSSSASCPMRLPLLWISRTVSALYSSENFLRFRSCSIVHSSARTFALFGVSIKPGQLQFPLSASERGRGG